MRDLLRKRRFKAIIVGAGLAGLSVAKGLGDIDDLLLVDRRPIGSDPNPPHETILPYIEEIGGRDAVVDRFESMDVRTSAGEYTIRFFHPHCTLNYPKLCDIIRGEGYSRFILGEVEAVDDHRLKVNGEIIEADFIVDCSGWRSLVTSKIGGRSFGPLRMTTAMATTVSRQGLNDIEGPTYFFDPEIIPRGGGFVIPFGDQALIGLASYAGAEDLSQNLKKLLKVVGAKAGLVSRDFIPNHGLRPTSVGDVLAAGDAAGQAKPVRGKGILRGTLYGRKCGEAILSVIDGRKDLEEAKEDYARFVAHERPIYGMMLDLQMVLISAPDGLQAFIAAALARDSASLLWDKMY